MAEVEFKDFSIQVKGALDDAIFQFLEEAADVIQAEAQRNTAVGKVGGGKTKGDWKHTVDESKKTAYIGNTNENSIWEELGTGEYALEGKGRKGGWYIPIGNGVGQISEATVKAYNMRVKYGKDGQRFAYTEGKRPKRMLHNAYTKKKQSIINRAKTIVKGRMS